MNTIRLIHFPAAMPKTIGTDGFKEDLKVLLEDSVFYNNNEDHGRFKIIVSDKNNSDFIKLLEYWTQTLIDNPAEVAATAKRSEVPYENYTLTIRSNGVDYMGVCPVAVTSNKIELKLSGGSEAYAFTFKYRLKANVY